MEDKERGKEYTIRFIESHGGSEEVARKINMNRQTVRQVATGRNYPGFDLVAKMTATYPDYDLKSELAKTRTLISVTEGEDDMYVEDTVSADSNTSLDPIIVRLLAFIKRKEGPSEVARRIGTKPSVFYNYEAGRNKQPSSDILQQLAEAYDDFDPLYILTGRHAAKPVASIDSAIKDVEVEGYKREIALLKDTVNILRNVVGSQLGKDMQSKIESTSGANQDGQLMLGLDVPGKGKKRFIAVSLRDATGTTQRYLNPAPAYPTRR